MCGRKVMWIDIHHFIMRNQSFSIIFYNKIFRIYFIRNYNFLKIILCLAFETCSRKVYTEVEIWIYFIVFIWFSESKMIKKIVKPEFRCYMAGIVLSLSWSLAMESYTTFVTIRTISLTDLPKYLFYLKITKQEKKHDISSKKKICNLWTIEQDLIKNNLNQKVVMH